MKTAAFDGARGMRRAARSREAGFTLIELAVATVVLLLAVLLACELLAESGRLLHHSVRRARDPWTLIAAELLRNDLRGAAPPAVHADGFPHHEPLELFVGDDLVVWSGDDGKLVRAVGGSAHPYIQDVRRFTWRRLSGNAVEVQVRYHVSSPYLRDLAGSLPQSDPGKDEDLRLLVVTRGGGLAEQW